jgi:hypothetical protein
MTPQPVQHVSGDLAARALLIAIVRILAIGGFIMSVGVTLLLLEPALLVAFNVGSLARNVNWQGYGIPAFPYRDNTVYVTGISALLLLVSSIAALTLRPWGRVGMTWYAIASLAHMLVLLLFPPLYQWYFGYGRMNDDDRRNLINGVREAAVYSAVAVTSMIYPVLVIVIMRHPAVVALFQKVGIGFEPTFASEATATTTSRP